MKKLSFIFSAFLVFLFAACDMGIEEIKRFSELEYIKVDASEAKKSYLEGESFLSDGIKVYGYYTDNTVKEVDLKRVDFSGFPGKDEIQEIEMETDIPITVSMGEFSDSFNIRFVKKTITGITATLTQNLYLVGEDFDYSKIVVRPTYSDNTIGIPLNAGDFTVDGFISADVNSRLPLKVKYKTFETEVYVMIFNGIFEEILVYAPSKKIYTKTEKFDPTGMIVQGKYNNNYSLITVYKIEIVNHEELSDIDQLPPGNYDIVISVNSIKSDPFTIRILDKYQTGIALAEGQEVTPRNKVYKQGDKFFIKDFKFAKLLSDGSLGDEIPTGELSSTMDDQVLTEKGIIPVTVTAEFEDIVTFTQKTAECSFDICVGMPKLERIEAYFTLADTKATIPLGISPDNTDYGTWEVWGIPSYGDPMLIPDKYCTFEYENDDKSKYQKEKNDILNSENTQIKKKVIVTYFGDNGFFDNTILTTETEVSVGLPVITSVELVSAPNAILFQGEQVSLEGTVVELVYSTGEGNIRVEYNKTENAFEIINTDLDTSTPGIKRVEIQVHHAELKGVTYTFAFYVTVKPDSPTSLKVQEKNQEVISYRLGKEYNKDSFFNKFNIYVNYYSSKTSFINSDKKNKLEYKLVENGNYDNFNNGGFSKQGTLEVLYNTQHYVAEGSKFINSDITVFGSFTSPSLRLLPSCPKFASVEIEGTTSNLLDSLKSNNAKYTIDFINGETITFVGSVFESSPSTVKNGFIFSLNEETDNKITLHYKAIEKACDEETPPEDELPLITKYKEDKYNIYRMDIITKDEYEAREKRKFISNKTYEMSKFFQLKVTYLTGATKTVTSGITWNYDFDLKSITAEYMDHITSYSDFDVLRPVSLKSIYKGLHWDSDDTSYEYTNEMGEPVTCNSNSINTDGYRIVAGDNKLILQGSYDIENKINEYIYEIDDFKTELVKKNPEDQEELKLIQQINDDNYFGNTLKASLQFIYFLGKKEDINSSDISQFNVVYKDDSLSKPAISCSNMEQILPLADGGKDVLINYIGNNGVVKFPAKLYPAKPENNNLKKIPNPSQSGSEDNREIKFFYSINGTSESRNEKYSDLRRQGLILFFDGNGNKLESNRFDNSTYITFDWFGTEKFRFESEGN